MDLKGSVCLITGGGSGIGRATALLMAQRGAKVAVAGRTATKTDSVLSEIEEGGGIAQSHTIDVSDREAVFHMVTNVEKTLGMVNVLVNSAGHSSPNRKLSNTTPEEIRSVLASNLEELVNARQRTEFYRESLPEPPQYNPIIEPLNLALDVQEAAIDELLIAARELVVRAPVDGHVASLTGHRGRVVMAGEPLLSLIPSGVFEVEVFIPESALGTLKVDDTVLLTSILDPTLSVESLVVRIAPDVRALPNRLWLDPAIPEYGRVALVRGTPSLSLSPGERVLVRLPDTGS